MNWKIGDEAHTRTGQAVRLTWIVPGIRWSHIWLIEDKCGRPTLVSTDATGATTTSESSFDVLPKKRKFWLLCNPTYSAYSVHHNETSAESYKGKGMHIIEVEEV